MYYNILNNLHLQDNEEILDQFEYGYIQKDAHELLIMAGALSEETEIDLAHCLQAVQASVQNRHLKHIAKSLQEIRYYISIDKE